MSMNKIIKKNFWNPVYKDGASDLTEDELGWDAARRDDAGSNDTKDIFDHVIGCLHWDLSLFYTENEKYYYIDMAENVVRIRNDDPQWDGKYLSDKSDPWSLEWYDREHPELILMHFNNVQEVWDNFKIDGKDMRYIIDHSVYWLSS